MAIESASTGTSSASASPPTERTTPSSSGPAGTLSEPAGGGSAPSSATKTSKEELRVGTTAQTRKASLHSGQEQLHEPQQQQQHQQQDYGDQQHGHYAYYGHGQGQDHAFQQQQQQQQQQPYPLMSPVHPLTQVHPLHPNHFLQADGRSSQPTYYPGLNVLAPSLFLPTTSERDETRGPDGDSLGPHYSPGYHVAPHYSSELGQIQENQHPLSDFPSPEQNGGHYRYSLPSFPQGHTRGDYGASSFSSSAAFMQASGTDGPIIHHRNSIAGTTLPHPVVRARRAGSLATVEDGPYFANTRQFHNVYSMDQMNSFKFRVMARIDRGFFTANKIWTCYRRNYFQVSTAFNILGFDHTRDCEVPCLLDTTEILSRDADAPEAEIHGYKRGVSTGGLSVVTHFSVCIASRIASSEKKIDLIQHTPKRDKGPQIVPGLRNIKGGGALTALSATPSPSHSSGSPTSPSMSAPQSVVTYERVQFKTATANNGKRQAAQQFYILFVDLYAHTEEGTVYCVASSQSDSLVVRGRSPGHYVDLPERSLSISSISGLEGGSVIGSPTGTSPGERRLSNVSQHGSHPYHHSSHHHHHPYSSAASTPHSRTHSISAGVGGMSIDVGAPSLSGLFGAAGAAARDSRLAGGPLSPMTPLSPMSPNTAAEAHGGAGEGLANPGTLMGQTGNTDGEYSPGMVNGGANGGAQSYFPYPTYQAWTDQAQAGPPHPHQHYQQHPHSQQYQHQHPQHNGVHMQQQHHHPGSSLSSPSSNYEYDSSSFSSPTTPYPTGYSTGYPTGPYATGIANGGGPGITSVVTDASLTGTIPVGSYPQWNGYST